MGTNITGIGNANAIGFKSRVTGGTYFPPELKDALVGVWSAYGKSNDSTDRNIIKNKIKDKGGDFELVNFNYEGTSGYNGYPVVFGKDKTYQYVNHSPNYNQTTINVTHFNTRQALLYSYIQRNGELTSYNRDYPSYKIKVSGLEEGFGLMYQYNSKANATSVSILKIEANGIYTIPKSFASDGSLTNANVWIGFIFTGTEQEQCNVTIEVLPEYKGAVVTDGIDDMIVSQKSVQEMLGGSNEITVVSMAHFIKGESGAPKICRINQIRRETRSIRNSILEIGKSGIFGYTYKNGVTTINNILGDKNDCVAEGNLDGIVAPFSVEGYYYNNNSNPLELCSIAWYWTIIANKVLTTDQINQVIAYYNLDRCVEPTVLYDVKRQGLSNDTPDSDWYLKDFSKNGFDMSLFNFAKKGNSGVGKYETDLSDTRIWTQSRDVTSSPFSSSYNGLSGWIIFANTELTNSADMPSFKIQVKGLLEGQELIYRYYDSTGQTNVYSMTKDGEYTLPSDVRTAKPLISNTSGFQVVKNDTNSITITQIPSHAGALCFDGVNDFGKVTGMPIYKDYTVVTDREIFANIGAISSKNNPGAFVETAGNSVYSFGQATSGLKFISTRSISYLSKYSYCGQSITAGAAEDGTDMWLGTIRDNDSRFFNGAIYSLMSFPYSMSEFLIERQLKKHKLGTLYPDMVEFRPVIKANANYKITYYQIDSTNTWKSIKVGDYIVIGAKLAFQITFDNDASELKEVVSPQLSGIIVEKRPSNPGYNIYSYITSKSPQKINITIDEYIRFEDIVQPYPVLLRFNDENGNEVSWGGKFRVGSTITRIGGIDDTESNLLNGLYSISGLSLNGKAVTSSTSIVEKQMVFRTTATWLLDNNEPKVILSPSRLRIPNSSYKLLGYIPDISGHGNNGKINNSAYASMSGANGYLLDFKTFTTGNSSLVNIKDDSRIEVININKEKSTTFVNLNKSTSISLSSWKIKVTGMKSGDTLGYYYSESTDATLRSKFDIKSDGIYSLPSSIANSNNIGGIAFDVVAGADSAYRIEQIGEYEGAYCLDGVDDFVTIPTLSSGGKQVLMKTNWLKSPTLLYDQRASESFAILTTKEDDATNPRIAYQARNQDGKTYIDGIENNYIETYSLKGITHNITVTNPSAGSGVVPVIGANTGKSSSFAKMALYDFMLFDEVSTDEEIKQLNDIVGIEGGYVQKPPYYWDAYGKTNSDDDRSTIQQRGTAVGDYDITNYNHAYEGMSGYNGYPVVFGTNKTYANLVPNDGNFILTSSHNIINVTKFDTSYGLLYSHIKLDGKLTSRNIDYPSYKIKVTGLGENFGLHYSYLESSSDTTVKGFEINNDGIYIIPKSFASDGSLTSNSDWIGFIFTGTAPESCNVTIEVLPEYENGLVYDGVDDYSENTSIPAFTDYTYIIKYEDFNNPNTGSCIQRKGSIKAGGGAFVQDHIYRGTKYQYNFGISSNIHKDDSIAFCTKTNYNGTAIPSGNNTDDTGFTIGKFDGYRKMVFYKEMLYPRTVNMLTINMIKNMMAEDGIIDIQGKLFTDKYTGDFNLDFNKDFLIGN
jgi:hypothetical protein